MRTMLVALLAIFATADAGAAVLYKLVDSAGNTTFSDSVPQGFRGAVTRLDIDIGTNVITPSPSGVAVARTPIDSNPLTRPRDTSGEERLAMAARRLDDARLALADAQNNSLAEDWIYLGTGNPLGMRRRPRPEYQARLDQLAGNVVVAEAEYEALRRELR